MNLFHSVVQLARLLYVGVLSGAFLQNRGVSVLIFAAESAE